MINRATIQGAGTIDVPQDYQYVDADVEPDTEYYYYVEGISMTGVRERVTPTIKSQPKSAG